MKFKSIKTNSKIIPNSKPVTISLPTKDLDKVKIKRSFNISYYIVFLIKIYNIFKYLLI